MFGLWKVTLFLLVFLPIALLESTSSQAMTGRTNSPDLLDSDLSKKPAFLVSPKDAYVNKNKPALLTCRAAHAYKVTFKCNGDPGGKAPQSTGTLYDPFQEVKITETNITVTRALVEEYFGPFLCQCLAWGLVGPVTSVGATITVAYLLRHFAEHPYSKSVARGKEVELRCLPPEGIPRPLTSWLKDGRTIDPGVQHNYRISSEGSLLILTASPDDSANYTCVAENIAARRVSETAVLKVLIDGSWSDWSAWSSCSSQCGRGFLKRVRTCTAPKPSNGGASCPGSALEKNECGPDCSGHYGSWSLWSDWGICDSDCKQHRQRTCLGSPHHDSLDTCPGVAHESVNCTGGQCRKPHRVYGGVGAEEAREAAFQQDITLIVVLATLVPLVLLLLVFVFRKFNRKDRDHRGPLYEIASTEYPMPFYSSTPKKVKVVGDEENDNCLRIVYEPPYTDSSTRESCPPIKARFKESLYTSPPLGKCETESLVSGSEHHYDVPDVRTESPITSETVNLLAPTCGVPGKFAPEKLCGSHSPYSLTSNSSTSSSRNTHGSDSTPAHSIPEFLGEAVLERGTALGFVGPSGSRLAVPECGVSLMIPECAIEVNSTYKMFISALPFPSGSLVLTDRETLLSSVIYCGPSNISLQKPVVISFEHCASLQHAAWKLHILACANRSHKNQCWTRIITLGEEMVNTPVYTQLDGSQVHLMTESLQQFVLVGESAGSSAAVKQIRVLASAAPPSASGELAIWIHVIQDTSAALAYLTQQERGRSALLLDKPKTLLFQDCGSNLCITLDEVGSGWRQRSNYQELSFESIWGAVGDPISCSFVLERTDKSCGPLSCRVVAQQKGSSTHRQVVRVNTDFPYAPVTASPPTQVAKTATASSSGCSSMVALTPEPAFRIPLKVRKELCQCLDQPNARGNDWRMLAARMNVDRYLNYFASKASPTEHILDLWEARHREVSALTDLLNVFRVMGRPDAARILESHSGSWI